MQKLSWYSKLGILIFAVFTSIAQPTCCIVIVLPKWYEIFVSSRSQRHYGQSTRHLTDVLTFTILTLKCRLGRNQMNWKARVRSVIINVLTHPRTNTHYIAHHIQWPPNTIECNLHKLTCIAASHFLSLFACQNVDVLLLFTSIEAIVSVSLEGAQIRCRSFLLLQ